MTERLPHQAVPQFVHHIDCYNPRNITGPTLVDDIGNPTRDDSHFEDALALLRQGIWELREIDGLEGTRDEQVNYSLTERTDGLSMVQWDKQRKTQEDNVAGATTDEEREKAIRDSFLMIDWNTKDGIIGVAEGRIYTFGGTGDRALLINWVVTRNWGSNDDDQYTYRRAGVGRALYERIEELAKEKNIELLIAAVNPRNEPSQRFHEGQGFRIEEFEESYGYDKNGIPNAHKTENGAFLPPYVFEHDGDNNPINYAEYYTKRLSSPQSSEPESV